MPSREATGRPATDWSARSDQPRRSIFGNYSGPDTAGLRSAKAPGAPAGGGDAARSDRDGNRHNLSTAGQLSHPASDTPCRAPLQASIDLAMARAFIYGFLARAFADPDEEGWQWLCRVETAQCLDRAVMALRAGAGTAPAIPGPGPCPVFLPEQFEVFRSDYVAAFGHAARGQCPLNEIEYGDLKADPLFQPHRLADLAAFYRAFGLEVADDAAERQDHIGLELEFMCVLSAREAFALEHQAEEGELEVCRDAQRKFLGEHPGRWLPAFTRRLARSAGEGHLTALARFTRQFIFDECARFGIAAGSDDLLLRPADSAAESLCDACGLRQLPPGAAAAVPAGRG